MVGLCCPTSTELFSKPKVIVEPEDIFEGDDFKLNCFVSIYVPERVNKESMRFSFYKDNVKLTGTDTYITVADPRKNGNYSCRAQPDSLTPPSSVLVKESQTVVVKAKGGSSNIIVYALYCHYIDAENYLFF